ncbi:hypothetical protein CU669_12730 [Paramagnetospirillum kuznetsovii]|uniref:PIN domain-containing protein n=1 Tax=Paramagnetospirillum kuznetsovii TaxID=2053833 RepID=A0A364NWW0_9PROT|nr:PIN domain-containing protein [Paramagnetospirillum kuznetsovii]RAU21552.1 hypothetical protein CU669_12730 [Paramagnetospirillum kuznetsovii]
MTGSRALILDSNLLLLYVVGATSRSYINKHKRLRAYSPEAFDLLCEFIKAASSVMLTPNTLTETSNLIDHIGEPARSRIWAFFRQLLSARDEMYLASRMAAERDEFVRLGLTDSILLCLASTSNILLTVDAALYEAAARSGYKVENFNHHRERLNIL